MTTVKYRQTDRKKTDRLKKEYTCLVKMPYIVKVIIMYLGVSLSEDVIYCKTSFLLNTL